MASSPQAYILGLDLGAVSVGWAVLHCPEAETADGHDSEGSDLQVPEPSGIIKAGVRLFKMQGGGTAEEYTSGKDTSPAEARRAARLMRRQHQRRGKRRQRILDLLQRSGLLPPGDVRDRQKRMTYFAVLDRKLIDAWISTRGGAPKLRNDPDFLHVFPYKLRAEGIVTPLWPHAFGRALYHLSQRRGFQSNRKDEAMLQALDDAPEKDTELSDEEKNLGVVKKGIRSLEENMCAGAFHTVGQYLASLIPSQTRIRGRFTSREMIRKEFDALWERQRELQQKTASDGRYPDWLRDAVRDALKKEIFYQRPLKSQKGLVGRCSLEKDQSRAPWNCEEAQEFRLLQKLNDLAWFDKELTTYRLNEEQRKVLLEELHKKASLKFSEMRKILHLPKGTTFNFERDDPKGKIPGHRMNARMCEAFGDAWFSFSPERKAAIVQDVGSIQNPEALKSRGMRVWGLDEAQARKLVRGFIDDGYCDLSKKAIRKLLPRMREGEQYGRLRPELYPLFQENRTATDFLPPVLDALDTLRNPAVIRCLTETRKVVNALIREYGKPVAVRIELARDMKNSRDKRAGIAKRNRQQATLREKAANRLKERGIPNPKRSDIEKLLLAEECGWRCPYTGKSISWEQLFSSAPEVEIEHILPYSRTFDDSFANKTLCFNFFNREKGNRLPSEAVRGEAYEAMLRRVEAFHSPARSDGESHLENARHPNAEQMRKAKLERFKAKDLQKYEGFISRQLNDTRHASRVAMEYLGLLYGNDAPRRVQAGRGGVTSILRGVWRLNEILGDGGEKSRDDHRHHAVDAIAIACTSKKLMHNLQRVAQEQEREQGLRRLRLRGKLRAPWENFLEDARQAVYAIVPSWRVDHRVRGALHKETNYAKRTRPEDGKEIYGYRVKVSSIGNGRPKESDIDTFVKDLIVRDGQWEKNLREQLLTQASDSAEPHAAGSIRAVRVEQKSGRLLSIGSEQPRLCLSAANHHAAIFAVQAKGKERWASPGAVTLFTAMQRVQRKEAAVDREAVADGMFLFTLASGDCIRVMYRDAEEFLWVRTVYGDGELTVEATRMNDARRKSDIKKEAGSFFRLSLKQLQEGGCHKIRILPSGKIVRCNE